jgi:prevent-host-death family protein
VDDPNHKGNVAELAIATEAARLGLSVLKPLTEHERYDLVLGVKDRLFRVQCKWGARRRDVIVVRLSSCYHSPTRGYVKATYDAKQIDFVAVHCSDLQRSYLLPASLFVDRGVVTLRLKRAGNNQRAAINWAADYEFQGAIAQLEERLTGSQEVVGSSPTSSIASEDPGEDPLLGELDQAVGMDEFYGKLASYVRRAEAGEETLITRWGKPVARLGPAILKDRAVSADE